MEMSRQATVVEQKQQFLHTRKHLLSRGIVPSERLKTIAHDGGIELSVLKGALDKGVPPYKCSSSIDSLVARSLISTVNRDLKQHSRKVYSRQMAEHVVEQIDELYWATGARELDDEENTDGATDIGDDSSALYQSDDLTEDKQIAKLPAVWDTSADPHSSHNNDNVDQDTYMTSVARLQDLSARRLTLQQRLNTYRILLSLLEPYRRPKENIQPNLVWRESPLAPELVKTRTLAIRVAGRVSEKFGDIQVPATMEEEHIEMEDDSNAKLDRILVGW